MAMSPAEARFSAVAMSCLSLMSLGVGIMVAMQGQWAQGVLFGGLAALGAWQVGHFRRHAQ